MPQDVRTNGLGYPSAVCYSLYSILNSAHRYTKRILKGKVVLQDPPDPVGHRNYAALCFLPVWTTFTVNHETPLLPLDIVLGKI